jgi:hypothetical protein
MRIFTAMTLLGGLTGCVHTSPRDVAVPLSKEEDKIAETSKPVENPTAGAPAPSAVQMPQPDPCVPPAELGFTMPKFVADSGVIITRIANPCLTKTPEGTFKEQVSWMAMGVPCTGGGKIDVTGYLSNPKMLAFPLTNACPMKPDSPEEVQTTVGPALGLGENQRLIAYYPLAIQYWELGNFPDADFGSVVEVRSAQGLTAGWSSYYRKNQPLIVTVYGRENAWVAQNAIYRARLKLIKVSDQDFRAEVESADILSEDATKEALERCSAKYADEACRQIFSP